MRSISAVFDEDRLEDVRRVLARVHGLLELLVDVLPADDVESVVARAEELGDRLVVQPVALVLELAELDQLALRVAEALEPLDRLLELRRRPRDHLALRPRSRPDLGDPVADDVARGLVDVVADVVERASEPVHVVTVERRHERPVQQVDDLVREAVALVLELLDVADQVGGLSIGLAAEEIDEQPGDRDSVRRRLVVELEELLPLRNERDPGHAYLRREPAARLLPRLRCPRPLLPCLECRPNSRISRRSAERARRASPTRRSLSAPRSSTTTVSRGTTSPRRSCSRRAPTAGASKASRPTSTSRSRICTSRSRS